MTDINNPAGLPPSNGQQGHKPPNTPLRSKQATQLALIYDIVMLVVIVIDLSIISLDLVLMSNFIAQVAQWLNLTQPLMFYVENIHHPLRVLGGLFTIFLISELAFRWMLAVFSKQYSRWFFFPFAHWYEVLGCFPQFRALRLLRAFFIGRKLYQLGYQILPQKWINRGKFYYDVIFEELSDRVILTATDNLRQQFADEQANQRFLNETLIKNRPQIQTMLSSVLKQELGPQLRQLAKAPATHELSVQVGVAVQQALTNTPELRRYLRMIPIAGNLIEGQLHNVSQNISENITQTLFSHLTQSHITDAIIDDVAQTIANINLENPELDLLVNNIINDGLTAFENQVKVQQWKHQEYLHL
ncbi:hypothetical protein [Psychrobacter sp.]|uniref:hypothetical protein n=1 Tax=Psychrobacter sp. TaxID=56811 RepID=UPI0025FFC614|nr:hypothetical protein [Psychrobacter sp.]